MAAHSSILAGDPMDEGAWQATVCGVAKSWTQLSMHAQERHIRLFPPQNLRVIILSLSC